MSKQESDLMKMLKEKQEIVLGLVVALMAILVLGPVLTKLRSRLADRSKLTKSLETLEEKHEALAGIDSILIDERVKKMEAVFPSDKPIVQLIGTLSQLSGQHGLSFGGVSLKPGSLGGEDETEGKTKAKKASVSGLQDLKFGFEVGGSFADILEFMSSLENVAPLMKVEKVGLTIKTNPLFESQSTVVVASIDVAAYYQPPPKQLGSVSQPVKLLTREQEALLNKLVNFKTFEAVFPVAPTGKVNLFGAEPQSLGVQDSAQESSQAESPEIE